MEYSTLDSGDQTLRRDAKSWLIAALAVMLVLSASLGLRLYPTLKDPLLKHNLSFPVLNVFDGYLYLRYAKEYCEGTYEAGEVDELRGAHNKLLRPSLPMLSAFTCYAHRATGASMEHVALFLPVVLSAFVSIPIWLYRKRIGGELVAAVAIVFTLTSQIYTTRTMMGSFDTDCLIPFFFLMVLWLLHKVAETPRWQGVVYAVAGGLVFRLFMLWYPKPILYFIFAATLVLLLILYHRENRSKIAIIKVLVFLLIGLPIISATPWSIYRSTSRRTSCAPAQYPGAYPTSRNPSPS
jgi:dolichyl-diphosphooligosaccharide--protein glycosyltransferase